MFEFLVVLIMVALLLAVLLPRIDLSSEDAHRVAVKNTAGAFASATVLARAQWVAQGRQGAHQNLPGFGQGTVNMSAQGWPVSVDGGTDPGDLQDRDCLDLWHGLLQSGAPLAALEPMPDVAYQVEWDNGWCRYRYQSGEGALGFAYRPTDGEVRVRLRER